MSIHNTWEQLKAAVGAGLIPKKHAVAISSLAPPSRGAGGGTHAWSPFFQTDPSLECAWYNHQTKAFHGYDAKDRKEAVELAKIWVKDTYGYDGPWKRNSMRDWIPEIVNKNFPIKRSE